MKKRTGFTFIELLIVIAIIAILAGLAYPSYQSHILKARRAEAQTELSKAQLKQTSLHILNPSYSDDERALGLIDNDYYTFSVISASTTTYSMKAVAKGKQLQDSNCLTLTIDQNNNQTPPDCW